MKQQKSILLSFTALMNRYGGAIMSNINHANVESYFQRRGFYNFSGLSRTNTTNLNEVFTASDDCPCVDYLKLGDGYGSYCNIWNDAEADEDDDHYFEIGAGVVSTRIHRKMENIFWCHIDPKHCSKSFSKHANSSYISFTTCGNLHTYREIFTIEEISNSVLRVAFPGDTSDGYNLITLPQSSDEDKEKGMNKVGASVDFIRDVSFKYNMTWDVKSISQKSKLRYNSSSFTACVHDISIGEIDLCIGNFWMTTERLLLSSFTNTLYQDEFHLVSKKFQGQPNIFYQLLIPFRPFYMSAWVAILLAIAYASFVIRVIQKGSFPSSLSELRDEFGAVCFWGVANFTTAEIKNQSMQPKISEKVVTMGFMLFALITLTAYTATSAAFLISRNARASFNSLDEVLLSGGKLCIETALKDGFEANWPEFEGRTLEVKNILIGYDLLDAEHETAGSGCVAAIVKNDALGNIQANYHQHCDKIKAPGTLFAIGNAYPITEKYRKSLSYVVDVEVQNGEYKKVRDDAWRTFIGSSVCSEGNSGFMQLDESELFAPLFFTVLCSSIALAVYFWNKYMKKSLSDDFDSKPRHLKNATLTTRNSLCPDESKDTHRHDILLKYDDIIEDTFADQLLLDQLSIMSLSQLLKETKSIGVNKRNLESAMNHLPNLDQIIWVLFEASCSQATRESFVIRDESLSTLLHAIARLPECQYIRKAIDQNGRSQQHFNDPKSMKTFVEDLIRERSQVRHAVVDYIYDTKCRRDCILTSSPKSSSNATRSSTFSISPLTSVLEYGEKTRSCGVVKVEDQSFHQYLENEMKKRRKNGKSIDSARCKSSSMDEFKKTSMKEEDLMKLEPQPHACSHRDGRGQITNESSKPSEGFSLPKL